MIIKEKGNVLVISDAHLPFTHKKALDFVCRTRDTYKCDVVIGIGDFFDCHAISYHEKDPDGDSCGVEMDKATFMASKWVKEFPTVYQIIGNHTDLLYRKAKTHGLSKKMIRTFNEAFGLPNTWMWDDEYEKDGVRYQHGTGKSGKYAYMNWATDNMQSTVTGHTHSSGGIGFTATNRQRVFGMGVGCLIDKKSYAMSYGKHFAKKPLLACGVVLDDGEQPVFVPMKL